MTVKSGQLPGWFGVPFLLGGLFMLGLGVVLLLDEMRFGNEGATTAGVVVEKNYSPGGGDSGPSYELAYQFVDPATGTLQEGASDVSEETYDATSLGGTVDVTYLPATPTKSRIGTTELQLFVPVMVIGGGVIFLVVGAAMLVIVPRLKKHMAATAPTETRSEQLAEVVPDPFESVVGDMPAPSEFQPTSDAELRALDARLAPNGEQARKD